MAHSLKSSPQIVSGTGSEKPVRQQELKTYKRRYLVCITFAFNSISNAMMWITFAPIQSTAADYFNVSQSAINMYSLVFMILYVPGSLLCAWMFNKYYLRKSFIFSSFAQFIGSVLRYIATLHFVRSSTWNESKYLSYVLALIGQLIAAFCQPFYTNSPARIGAEWFGEDGRDAATAILSIINPLGIGLGSFIPTLFVSSDGNHLNGFTGIMLLEVIMCGMGFLLMLLFFYDKPPTSPSVSQKLKHSSGIKRSIKYDLIQIMKNKQFFFLLCGFGIGLGLFNALTTLINQYTAAFGYSTDDAGNFGGLLIGGGLLGAVAAGVCMELFRSYRTILKIFTFLTCTMMLFLLWQLKAHNLAIVTLIFGLFGFYALPIVAVTFECAAECTYPANEELSCALLMTSGSMFGIVYILIWGSQLPNSSQTYDNQWNFSTYFLVINGCVMLFAMLLFQGKYKRLNAEHEFSKYIEDLAEEDISVIESETWAEKQIQNNKRQVIVQQGNENSVSDRYQNNMTTPVFQQSASRSNGPIAAYVNGNVENSLDKPIKFNDT